MELTESQKIIYRALDEHTNDLREKINDYLDQSDVSEETALLINAVLGTMHRSQYELMAQILSIIEGSDKR
ncbi:hypothetical protein [Paenibacillus elgii]|uniref:hypothetical protein n=1 Tax=Paenibacillus elgii TaxID=189691 RepID=UPI0013D30CB0|nr:hypothetical protein [Paenibacillus elgii]